MDYTQIKRPGVYLEETPLLPPSVAGVSTAVPAFIGYTEFARKGGKDIPFVPTRINSMMQYQQYFGGAPDRNIEVILNPLNAVERVNTSTLWYLYDSVQMFFANGGEICYIVSAGSYSAGSNSAILPLSENLKKALDALKKYDEPTLIAIPDAMCLAATVPPTATEQAQIAVVQQYAVDQCNLLQDRFAILDVFVANRENLDVDPADLDAFRGGVGSNLKYAAAYYPWLKTAFPVQVSFSSLTIKREGADVDLSSLLTDSTQVGLASIVKNYTLDWQDAKKLLLSILEDYNTANNATSRLQSIQNNIDNIFLGFPKSNFRNTDTQTLLEKFQDITTPSVYGTKLNAISEAAATLALTNNPTIADCDKIFELFVGFIQDFISQIKVLLDEKDQNAKDTIPLYANMVKAAVDKGIVIPPSGAVAGVYAAVDATRGVWKAPANVMINGVVGPVVRITDDEHKGLNVHENGGKSINAIRNYTGKGTLIMGARTMAGNDNEWRYINVRRLFVMIETAVKKATEAFIFEPNTITTWLKVKGMIESYLYGLWQNGALAGAKPEQAYFVNVGLGKTMSQDDILNGRMIVEIGIAAVRPAEFIFLRFSHKMQEA